MNHLALTFSIFCLFLCSLSFILYIYIPPFFTPLPPKHSYLDRETSLILKSIAGKPSHLLTKVTSSNTHFFFWVFFFSLSLSSVHTAPLLCFACEEVEKSIH